MAPRKRQPRPASRLSAAAQAEQRDEAQAPAAQRQPVIGRTAAGVEMLRGPLVERAGKGFVRSNPLRNLWSRSRVASRASGPVITDLHLACSERLLRAWNETSEGVNVAAGSSLEAHIRSPTTGAIAIGVLHAINHQIAQEREWHMARAFVGAELWVPIHSVVLLGKDVRWFAGERGWDERVAMGYLVGALDRLCAFYAALMPGE